MSIASAHRLALAVAIAAASHAPSAAACGACVEDKVAATYDHAVIQRAMERRQQVVFVAFDGGDAEAIDRLIRKAAVPGVVPGTIRTSRSPAAFSFALDERAVPALAVGAYGRAVGASRARLTLVRIVRNGQMIAPQ